MNPDREKWIKSIGVSLLVFILFSIYLFLRRGYYNLYIINKVFGSTAIVLAGFSLLVGPLSRSNPFFSRFMTIRRQLGLSAFVLAIAHIIASLLQQNRFPLFSWYTNEWIPVLFGIVAVGIWVYMTYISRNSKIKQMGIDVWKRNLSIAGKLAFIAIFFHLTVMKYEGWIRWFRGQVKATPELANPSYPPASLFVLLIMVIVILYRVMYYFKTKTNSRRV